MNRQRKLNSNDEPIAMLEFLRGKGKLGKLAESLKLEAFEQKLYLIYSKSYWKRMFIRTQFWVNSEIFSDVELWTIRGALQNTANVNFYKGRENT